MICNAFRIFGTQLACRNIPQTTGVDIIGKFVRLVLRLRFLIHRVILIISTTFCTQYCRVWRNINRSICQKRHQNWRWSNKSPHEHPKTNEVYKSVRAFECISNPLKGPTWYFTDSCRQWTSHHSGSLSEWKYIQYWIVIYCDTRVARRHMKCYSSVIIVRTWKSTFGTK